jgi:hypothetical protein
MSVMKCHEIMPRPVTPARRITWHENVRFEGIKPSRPSVVLAIGFSDGGSVNPLRGT